QEGRPSNWSVWLALRQVNLLRQAGRADEAFTVGASWAESAGRRGWTREERACLASLLELAVSGPLQDDQRQAAVALWTDLTRRAAEGLDDLRLVFLCARYAYRRQEWQWAGAILAHYRDGIERLQADLLEVDFPHPVDPSRVADAFSMGVDCWSRLPG